MLIQDLTGDGGTRGLAHGTALAAPIRDTVDALRAHLAADGIDPVVLDGERYKDPNSTFAAFSFRIGDSAVSLVDGRDLRARDAGWTRVDFA